MNEHKILGFGLALITVFCISVSAAATPVAIVTDASADAPVALLDELEQGRIVVLGDGQSLTIVYYSDNREYRFSGVSSLRLEVEKPIVLSGSSGEQRDLKTLESTGLKPGVHNLDQAAVAFRYVETDEKKIRGLQPNNTRVLSPHPVFTWDEVGAASQHKYRFKLVSTYGRVIHTDEVSQPSTTLPADISLTPGTLYNWQVDTGAGEQDRIGRASFTVATTEQTDVLAAAEPASGASFSEQLVYTLLLESNGFRDAANERWQMLAAQRPTDEVLARKAKGPSE